MLLTNRLIVLVALLMAGGQAVAAQPGTQPATAPSSLVGNVLDAKGLDQALERLHAPMRETAALSPEEEHQKFKTRPGLAVDLVASEPAVRQPLCINFDERGRMWVVQYIQYPFPAGMKVTEYDQYIRAKFDRISPPPPHQFRGHDKVTILEDVDGDGSFKKVKTFVDGLNIATSALPGRGGRGPNDYGVWVMNPPYLLFYPDKNHDDVPDSDPIVHLSGFGMEDTHAVASNLTWGPDGWLYGTQGSTCTAKVKVEITGDPKTTDFLGQAIWRYQPESHRFEVFAEGGGNTFGLEFDDAGRAYSGTNWGKYRGLHYVQGGYYVKSWGKHGPLTNPYAFGYFEHMPHTGNADRLSHTYIVYGGGLLGDEYTGKIISPNPLQSRIQVTRLEPTGSSYTTVEEQPYMVTCDDGWFRPVDLKAGPDGAIYVADFYEKRISHVDPRDTWDRTTGRIWRIRPANWKPGLNPFDLNQTPTPALVEQLKGKNRWGRSTARIVLAERQDQSVAPSLRQMVVQESGQPALEALWALDDISSLDDETTLAALRHAYPPVRMWAVRLAADAKNNRISSIAYNELLAMALRETDPQVRSQLASSSKRLPAEQSIPLIREMLKHDADATDAHIPLLLWWALEDKAVSARDQVITAFTSSELWTHPLARDVVLPRLARRYAADPTPENQEALAKLVKSVPGDAERALLLGGVKEGFSGVPIGALAPSLASALKASGDPELALRFGDAAAVQQAIADVQDEAKDREQRIRYIELLAQLGKPQAIPALLNVATKGKTNTVRKAAISALGGFDDPAVGQTLAALYPRLTKAELRSAAISTLLGRPAWTADLLQAIDSGSIPRKDLGITQIERVRAYQEPTVIALADKLFGKQAKPTSLEHSNEIARVSRLVTTGAGEAIAGKELFTTRCAICHTLFGEGGKVGPDLTGYERRNVDFLVLSIVDPSAYIREEFTAFQVRTRGGQTLIGLIVERGPNQITVEDAAQQKTVIPKDQIAEERALPTSLMPEGLLDGLSDQQVRDLFKYLSSDKPVVKRN